MKRFIALLLACPLAAGVFPRDKQQHFAMGFAVGFTATISIKWSGTPRLQSTKIGFLVGTGVGIAKEAQDWQSNRDAQAWGLKPIHSVDAGDAIATCLGAYFGSMTVHFLWPEPTAKL